MDIKKFVSSRLVFEIPVSGKINIIIGDNATGKTTLARTIASEKTSGNQGFATTDLKIVLMAIINDLDRDVVLIIDEDLLYELSSEEIKRFLKIRSKIVIFSRTVPNIIPVSYKDVYRYIPSDKYYKVVREYKDYDKFVKSNSYVIEGEEGKAESQYCNRWLKNVISANGNSNAVKYYNSVECAILDGAACGPFMNEVVKFKSAYLPISFEERICSCLFRNMKIDEYWWEKYPSLERYYFNELVERAKDIGISYNKHGQLSERILSIDIYDIRKSDIFSAALVMGGD